MANAPTYTDAQGTQENAQGVVLVNSDGTFADLSAGVGGGLLVDRSGTIAAGGTAQVLAAPNAARVGFSIQNVSAGDLWFSSLATAIVGQPSMKIPAGALYESPSHLRPTGAISIIGATTAQAFAAREW